MDICSWKNTERSYKCASSLHIFAAVDPFPDTVALAVYQSLLFTHILCLGAASGNAQTVLQVLSSLNEENNSGKPSLKLSSTWPLLNFFAHRAALETS